MLVRDFQTIEAEGRVISISHGKSTAVRVLTRSDGLGFSLSEARCGAGNESFLWYKHHWEANFIRAGRGELVDRDSGERWALYPGVLYCVGPNDRHTVVNGDDPLRIISIFNPAIEGDETHDEDGAFPPTGPIPAGPGTDPERAKCFVRTLDDVRARGDERLVAHDTIRTARYLKAADGLGFSLSEVNLAAGTEATLWYKHHWEANAIIAGELEVTDLATGSSHRLGPGGVYCVGPDDRHRLVATTDVKLLSVFNPPLTGSETHDEDGSYPPGGTVPPGPGASASPAER